jgi:RNA polymerase sigma factor FliA
VLATRKPARSALRANLRDESVVLSGFPDEIFIRKTTERVEPDKIQRTLSSGSAKPIPLRPDPMINPTTKFSLGPEADNAFQDLLKNHLPLVRSIVERMKRKLPSNIETEDLYSIGLTGLVAAARNYRRSQERTFGAYAAIRISGAILDELRRTDWMSRANRSKARRLSSAISKLEQEQGGSISHDSLCAEMQMTEDELTDLMEEVRRVTFVSIDGTHEQSELEDQSMHDIIPDNSCIPALDVLDRKEVLSLLTQRMAELPDTPKKVLAMYYYENMRLSEIAACFRLSESRICQIHTQTIALLRNDLVRQLA